MRATENLMKTLVHRAICDREWFNRNYEAAVENIEDHTDQEDSPHWLSPSTMMSLEVGGRFIIDDCCAELPIDLVEQMAFEMLVLCDLARSGRFE